MCTPPAGISDADWSSWPAGARALILAQQEENDQLRVQLGTYQESCPLGVLELSTFLKLTSI